MKRNINIVVEFPDNFVPPEKFDDPAKNKDYNSKCDQCPFFIWEEEHGFGCCLALGDEPETTVCPLKGQF